MLLVMPIIRTTLLSLVFLGSCSSLAIATHSTKNPHFDRDPYIYVSPGYPSYDGGRLVSTFLLSLGSMMKL